MYDAEPCSICIRCAKHESLKRYVKQNEAQCFYLYHWLESNDEGRSLADDDMHMSAILNWTPFGSERLRFEGVTCHPGMARKSQIVTSWRDARCIRQLALAYLRHRIFFRGHSACLDYINPDTLNNYSCRQEHNLATIEAPGPDEGT